MVRYLFYSIGDLTYRSPLVFPHTRLLKPEWCKNIRHDAAVPYVLSATASINAIYLQSFFRRPREDLRQSSLTQTWSSHNRWLLVRTDSSPPLAVNVSDIATACPAVSNNAVAGKILFSFCITPLCMDVSATTVWNRPAQPLTAEICDMTEHLLTFPRHSRQRTHRLWQHARLFTIYIPTNAQQ